MRRRAFAALVFCLFTVAALAEETRLTVEEPAGVQRHQWPVTSGIPMAQGVLRDDQAAALFDEGAKEIPLQTESLARWPDGSIRWLLLDFQIDLAAKQKKTLTFRYGPGTRRAPVEQPVRVTKQADGTVVIEPGPIRLEYNSKFDKGIFFPHGDAWLIDHTRGRESRRRLTYNCVADGVQIDHRDHAYKPRIEDIAIEQSGPVRVCIRASGSHVGGDSKVFRYVARVHAWRGQPYVRVFYTFINDRQDALMAKIESLRVVFNVFTGEEAWGLFDGKLRDLRWKTLPGGRGPLLL